MPYLLKLNSKGPFTFGHSYGKGLDLENTEVDPNEEMKDLNFKRS